MTFVNPSIIQLQNPSASVLTLSDHSRSPLSISYEVVEKYQRMVDGTARKYVIAKKKNFSCSWTMLPTTADMVVDSNADALAMKNFYEANLFQPLTLILRHKRNGSETIDYYESYLVYWSNFNYDVMKRYKNFDYWNATAQFTEI